MFGPVVGLSQLTCTVPVSSPAIRKEALPALPFDPRQGADDQLAEVPGAISPG
ncbi:hypothetical protein GCM10025734_19020 [Kitasatospora paranensis]